MSRPRRLELKEPEKPPKRRCVRGHVLRRVGWVLYRAKKKGKYYVLRRCAACLRKDVKRCRAS